MIPLNIVGGAYDGPRDELNPQRCVNLFPVRDKRTGGEDHLRHTPGLVELADISDDTLGDDLIVNGDFSSDSDWTYFNIFGVEITEAQSQWELTGGKMIRTPGGGDDTLGSEQLANPDFNGTLTPWTNSGWVYDAGSGDAKGYLFATVISLKQVRGDFDAAPTNGESYRVSATIYCSAGNVGKTAYLRYYDGSVHVIDSIVLSSTSNFPLSGDITMDANFQYIDVSFDASANSNNYFIKSVSVKEITGVASAGADYVEQLAVDMAGDLEEGVTYRLTFTVDSISGGVLVVSVAGTDGLNGITSSDTHVMDIIAGASGGVKFYGSANLTIQIDDASIEKVLDPQVELRGLHKINETLYAVHGNLLKVFDSDYNATTLNAALPMGTKSGRVTMAHVGKKKTTGYHLMICDGTATAYLYDTVDESFFRITEATHDFLGGGSVTAQDGYLLSNRPDTFLFYHSALNDGTSWDPLDEGAAEAKTNNISVLFSHHRELWAFKKSQIELFYNSGDPDLVFRRRGGGIIEIGLGAQSSVAELNDTLYWLADDFTVRRATGYLPAIISTERLSFEFEKMVTVEDAIGFGYMHEGHEFYQITFPAAERTFVYDNNTREWHERASYQEDHKDFYGRHRANHYVKHQNRHVIGDYKNNKLYYFDYETYKDGEFQIYRQRILPKISNNRDRLTINELELDMVTGVGLNSGQGDDPKIMVSLSVDGGNKYGTIRFKSFGKQGDTKKRVRFLRWGQMREGVFKLQISDPVAVYLYGAYMDAERGFN